MRGAFVVRLGPETRPDEGHFEGWAEEVDSGKELRFRSIEELVRFVGERFQANLVDEGKWPEPISPDEGDSQKRSER